MESHYIVEIVALQITEELFDFLVHEFTEPLCDRLPLPTMYSSILPRATRVTHL